LPRILARLAIVWIVGLSPLATGVVWAGAGTAPAPKAKKYEIVRLALSGLT
jgi:hypothetical protein